MSTEGRLSRFPPGRASAAIPGASSSGWSGPRSLSVARLSFVASLLVGGGLGVGLDRWVHTTDRGHSYQDRYRRIRFGYRLVVAVATVTALLGVLVLVVRATNARWLVLAFRVESLPGVPARRRRGQAPPSPIDSLGVRRSITFGLGPVAIKYISDADLGLP